MSQRTDAKKGSIDVTDGALPADLKAWGFAPTPGAQFTSLKIDNDNTDVKADFGWDVAFGSSALRTMPFGQFIHEAVVTGTITFYIA